MPTRSFNLAVLRLAEINKLCRHRYGGFGELPDDDSGRHDLHVLMHHHALLHSNVVRMRNIIAAKAPWMDSVEAGEIIQDACRSPRKWTADQLGKEMGLTEVDREYLGIRTIGSIDMTCKERRQLRDRRRQRKRRKAKGARMRTEYEAGSINRTEPWLALGISRRTWYRQKQNGTGMSHIMPTASRAGMEHTLPNYVRPTISWPEIWITLPFGQPC
jgi:hypothetical protein